VIVIATPRLLLRTWQRADREPFAKLNGDPRVMEFLGGPITLEQSDATVDRIEAHFREHGFGPLAIESRETETFIGTAGPAVVTFEHHFTPHWTPSIEIAWRLNFDYWGMGLATEAVRALLTWCGTTLKFKQVVAFTVPLNLRSRRVMEKSGMTHDPAGDFDHPNLPEGDPLRRHVLYSYTY
jgi:RimJ/RimL family protein N-acetyltransferase